MVLAEPRVTVAALRDLHQLLIDRRLRANSPDDSNIVREKCHGQASKRRSNKGEGVAVDTASNEHAVRLYGASRNESDATRKSHHASGKDADKRLQRRDCKGA